MAAHTEPGGYGGDSMVHSMDVHIDLGEITTADRDREDVSTDR